MRHRWFSVRLLFIVAAVVAVLATAYFSYRKERRETLAAIADVEQVGGHVYFTYEFDVNGTYQVPPNMDLWTRIGLRPRQPFRVEIHHRLVERETIQRLQGVKSIRSLSLRGSHLSDSAKELLGGFRQLNQLDVIDTNMSTSEVDELKERLGLVEVRGPWRWDIPGGLGQ